MAKKKKLTAAQKRANKLTAKMLERFGRASMLALSKKRYEDAKKKKLSTSEKINTWVAKTANKAVSGKKPSKKLPLKTLKKLPKSAGPIRKPIKKMPSQIKNAFRNASKSNMTKTKYLRTKL